MVQTLVLPAGPLHRGLPFLAAGDVRERHLGMELACRVVDDEVPVGVAGEESDVLAAEPESLPPVAPSPNSHLEQAWS